MNFPCSTLRDWRRSWGNMGREGGPKWRIKPSANSGFLTGNSPSFSVIIFYLRLAIPGIPHLIIPMKSNHFLIIFPYTRNHQKPRTQPHQTSRSKTQLHCMFLFYFFFEACIKKPPQLPPWALCIREPCVAGSRRLNTSHEWRDPWSARLGGSWDGLKRSPGLTLRSCRMHII